MKNFSLIIPTRKRPIQLRRFVDSIISTTKVHKNIDIHFGIDKDDIKTQDTVSELQNEYSFCELIPHLRGRGNSLVSHYINWIAINFCKSKYIITLNDDSLFKSQDWDINVFSILEEFMEDKPDGIVCGICKDNNHPKRNGYIATGFPLISKVAVEVLGFFLDPIFMEVTADDDICKLYSTIGRSVDLTDVFEIEHNPKEFNVLDSNYQTLKEKTGYVEFMERPEVPQDLRHFIDKRILKLLNHILKYYKPYENTIY